MKVLLTLLALWLTSALIWSKDGYGFCGFYAAKADSKLFNRASKVVLVRDGDRTVLTMASDYQGEPQDFALVVPVPVVLKEKQIHVTDNKIVDHLDSYTAPRLVEYFDEDPCNPVRLEAASSARDFGGAPPPSGPASDAAAFGVTVEASYEIGEYDILILSAKESSGLESWLRKEKYKIPSGASKILSSYIKSDLKFFVAKVNLTRHAKQGFGYLRPLQMAYESPRFDLPIRLGTVNANGDQELFVFALTRKGRVETTNYRTVKIPTGDELPPYVKGDFAAFYRDMFATAVEKEDKRAVFLEYAWDMSWCDPCAADPLSEGELRELGVYWAGKDKVKASRFAPSQGEDVFVTRLHLRYDAKSFPEDLKLQVTADRNNFQGRYVLRHPYTGSSQCEARQLYDKELAKRREREAQSLANLTGWKIDDIRSKMKLGTPKEDEADWIDQIWGK